MGTYTNILLCMYRPYNVRINPLSVKHTPVKFRQLSVYNHRDLFSEVAVLCGHSGGQFGTLWPWLRGGERMNVTCTYTVSIWCEHLAARMCTLLQSELSLLGREGLGQLQLFGL